ANAPEGALRAGALRAALPGRVQQTEVEGVRFVLDGAHNADAARSLRGTLAGLLPGGSRVVLLTGMVQGHDPEAFYRELAPIAAAAHAAPIAFHRSLAAHQVAEASTAAGITSTAHRGLIEALKAAVSDAGPTGCVIVTGSFYLVGEAGRALGLTS
ncbi:MAG: hypothetical protein HY248_01930, partial [Fimbriimonas ginsengisoli]|nr:hypothetical protein [Fimbriimonas ginsengisoli]